MKLLKWEEAKKEINKGTVFLEFYTTWCSDCKMIKPVLEEAEKIAKEKGLDVNFIGVDAEEASLFRNEKSDFQALKVPSFYVIKNGIKKHIGYKYLPAEHIINSIEE